MLTREELAALKPGDEVAWKRHGGWYITTVKTLAATSIVTADWNRWTKKHGKLFACGSDHVFLMSVTQEVRDAVEKQSLASRLVRIDWGIHTIETWRRVAASVEVA